MPILIVLIVLIALIYGAVWSFDTLAVLFGYGVAIGAAVVAAALLIAAIAWWWRRRRDVAANIHDGDWTHELKGGWGEVRLAAGKRLCNLQVDNVQGAYIFADLESATAQRDAQRGWQVELKVKDAKRPVWSLPVGDERRAKQWARIFTLAIQQKL
ncbi:hypothetical protein BWP39_09205 [Paraburkholderia acidicola]|uniref:Uncharacterized protein n=1 Tax=Paraburkholderia acidicola TaxID=1912599 RepID=A0A2A4F1I8_9BURK|nr:hypothetical protein [Paraburkholderia acidicola]PCE26955.1 hypothetical protein BWP39_09205 [Paraburkholderia acidicola]